MKITRDGKLSRAGTYKRFVLTANIWPVGTPLEVIPLNRPQPSNLPLVLTASQWTDFLSTLPLEEQAHYTAPLVVWYAEKSVCYLIEGEELVAKARDFGIAELSCRVLNGDHELAKAFIAEQNGKRWLQMKAVPA